MATIDMEQWFDGLNEDTAEPNAFGFDDGITDAVLTDVSLFESKNSTWTAVQLEFTDADGTTDNNFRISLSKKKTDGSKLSVKQWQRNVFQLMQPLILSDKNYKSVLDLETVNQGNPAVVEALQILVDKLVVRVEKTTPEPKKGEDAGFAEYSFLKVEAPKAAETIEITEEDPF